MCISGVVVGVQQDVNLTPTLATFVNFNFVTASCDIPLLHHPRGDPESWGVGTHVCT